jgi:hypothetical protein
MTPENDNEITEFIANLDFDPSVVKRFTTVEPITTIQGFLPPSSSLPNEIPHMHQIGVFGLAHTCNHLQRQDPAQMLFQAQSLAQNLLGIVKHPPESFVQTSLLSPVAKRQRVPKVWISVSEAATYSFSEPSRNRVIYQLKHSDFCHQLLGLSPIDRVLWKRTWGSMSEEERSKTEGLGRTFFGDPSQHYPLTSFLSIFVLMASEKGVKNTVFLRISLGLGDAVPLSCRHCERDVMLFDGIRATGALQLNVPSRQARSVRYESSEIIQSTEVEVAKWAERVGHLKGWWPCHFTKPLPGWASLDEDVEISRDKPFDLGIWDPDAKMEPAMCFQPYAQGAPDLWHPDRSSRKDYNMPDVFEPEPRNEEAWDPDGSFMRELSDDESDSDGT